MLVSVLASQIPSYFCPTVCVVSGVGGANSVCSRKKSNCLMITVVDLTSSCGNLGVSKEYIRGMNCPTNSLLVVSILCQVVCDCEGSSVRSFNHFVLGCHSFDRVLSLLPILCLLSPLVFPKKRSNITAFCMQLCHNSNTRDYEFT